MNKVEMETFRKRMTDRILDNYVEFDRNVDIHVKNAERLQRRLEKLGVDKCKSPCAVRLLRRFHRHIDEIHRLNAYYNFKMDAISRLINKKEKEYERNNR